LDIAVVYVLYITLALFPVAPTHFTGKRAADGNNYSRHRFTR